MGSATRERLGVVSGTLAIARTMGQTTGIALLGAIWANTIIALTPGLLNSSATSAPAEIQVAALQHTFTVVTIMMLFALSLGVWIWLSERKLKVTHSGRP
jgi:hypothetical protein